MLIFILFFYIFTIFPPIHRITLSHKKEDKHLEKDKDLSIKQEITSGKSESSTSPPPSMKDDRRHGSRFMSSNF